MANLLRSCSSSARLFHPTASPQFHLNIAKRFAKHPYKPKSREVFHPNVPRPIHQKIDKRLINARLTGPATFKPTGYDSLALVEKVRSGNNLGEEFPFPFSRPEHWARRRYNAQIEKYPWHISEVKGVHYGRKTNVFIVSWMEDGVYRFRWFRCGYGLLRAKKAAERFRLKLEALGRVDNRRTERHLRLQYLMKKKERVIKAKKFALISSGKM